MKINAKIVLMALLPTCVCAMHREKKVEVDYGKQLIDTASKYPRNWELVKKHIDKTDDIDRTNHYGETVFIIAAKNNKREILQLLADKGANVNHHDRFKRTALIKKALQETINEEDKKTMKLLVQELHAGKNIETGWGDTPLMLAMHKKNRNDLICWMIDELGFDVNYPNKQGYTMLMHAIKNKASLATIKMLVQRGALVNAEDKKGNTALSIARHYNNKGEIIQCLKDRGATDGMTDRIRRCAKYNWYDLRHNHGKQFGVLTALCILDTAIVLYGIPDTWSVTAGFYITMGVNPLIMLLWLYLPFCKKEM